MNTKKQGNQKRNKNIGKGCLCLLAVFIAVLSSIILGFGRKKYFDNSIYFEVNGKTMHAVLYGDIEHKFGKPYFKNTDTPTILMLPALGVESPVIYMEPLAQNLKDESNVIILEPFNYGFSDIVKTERTVNNIIAELDKSLNKLSKIVGINQFVIMCHSISGIYTLEYTLEHPEKVAAVIAIENTVPGISSGEEELALKMMDEFQKFKSSFKSTKDFEEYISKNPVGEIYDVNFPAVYDARLPQVNGYAYSLNDHIAYIKAYVNSSNTGIINEEKNFTSNIAQIEGKSFPDSIPVLMMIATDTIGYFPEWKDLHEKQININSGNHVFCIIEGPHFLWFTALEKVKKEIDSFISSNVLYNKQIIKNPA